MSSRGGLDSRTWLAWGMAAIVPLLTGRHPVVLAEVLLIVLVVRTVCLPPDQAARWGWVVRLGAIAVPVGVVFNALTVHAGDRVLVHVPDSVPFAGGEITWNAVFYGLLSGLTIVALVAAGTTVAAAVQWSALMRLLPARAATLAVAGSVAWTFLPQLATSWREIREAQTARGHRWRGARDAVPLVVPLMAGGLDRSLTMAEALEARGFGSAGASHTQSRWAAPALGLALTAAVTGLYLFAIGRSLDAMVVIAVAAMIGFAGIRVMNEAAIRPTHYRTATLTRADAAVMAGAAIAVLVVVLALQFQPAALRYEPYPTLSWPVSSPLLAAALGGLLMPAVLAPVPSGGDPR